MKWLTSGVRDGLIFLGGLTLTIYEAVFRDAERPSLLVLYAAMMGLPAVLNADKRKSEPDEKK